MKVQNHYFLVSVLLIIFCLIQPAAAISDNVRITDDIQNDGTIAETLEISLIDNTQQSIRFTPPPGAEGLSIDGSPAELQNGTAIITLSCTQCVITVSYVLPNAIVNGPGSYLQYSRTLNLPEQPRVLDYTVLLPHAYGVGADQGEVPVVPVPGALETDGKRIIIRWSETDPVLPQRFFVSYHALETVGLSLEDFWTELQEWPVIIYLCLFFTLGLLLGMFLKRKQASPEYAIPLSLLTPDERQLIGALRKGTVRQKELGKQLGWSKSKVSAIVTNLEQKRLLSREKIGRNYDVTLIENVGECYSSDI